MVTFAVVPHTGDVDRNETYKALREAFRVVPHTGDVDRNITNVFGVKLFRIVVPHTGDVDRNGKEQNVEKGKLSSRPPHGGRG